MRDRIQLAPMLALGLLLLPSHGALAGDGVIEINHARALAGGINPSDTPGYPVTIYQPGSYRLTSDLDVSGVGTNTHGLSLSGEDITIDLNGFSIIGPSSCTGSGSSISCGPTGSGKGIGRPFGTGAHNVVVKNGTIRGFPAQGINLSDYIMVLNVHTYDNADTGIGVEAHSIIRDCVARNNGGHGVDAGSGSNIARVVAEGNGFDGIQIDADGGLVVASTARGNGSRGIAGSDNGNNTIRGLVVTRSAAGNNVVAGILGGDGAVIAHNSIRENGGAGIQVGEGSVVRNNAVGDNMLGGIQTGAGSVLHGNNVTNNVLTGIATGGNGTLIRNTVRGHATGILGSAGPGDENAGAHNVITDNTVDVSGTWVDLGCNQIGVATNCPP